jgi:hypothetical protein
MGCAPEPKKSDAIARTNAQPSMLNLDKENRLDERRITKLHFEDIANHDFRIS